MDLTKFTDTVLATIKGVRDQVTARIEALEAKAAVPGPVGPQGERGEKGLDGAPGADGRDGIDGKDGVAGPQGPQGERGEKGDSGPQGEKGDVGPQGPAGEPGAKGERGEKGEKGDPGRDGKDADPEVVKALNEQIVTLKAQIAALQVEVTSARSDQDEQMAALVERAVAKAVSDIKQPEPVNVVGSFIQRDGHLVLTMSDGSTKDLGMVVGKNGEPGAKGDPGKDGQDGLGFEDCDVIVEDDGVYAQWKRGDRIERRKLPTTIYRDIYREGETYHPGDIVTWGGSSFIAKGETTAKPGMNTPESRAWKLMVKRGRDGASAYDIAKKNGFVGTEAEWVKSLRGPEGPQGPAGPVREKW